jgi:protein TonB
MARGNRFLTLSIVGHGILAFAVGEIRQAKSHEVTAIQMADAAAKKKPEPAKVEPEPKAKRPRASANRPAPLPKPESAPPPSANNHAALDALPDFGVALSGGVEGAGMALPAGTPRAASAARGAPTVRKLGPAAQPTSLGCEEPLVKPRPKSVPQPGYTEQARAAGIEGRVRVQLTVDETGRVVNVRLLQGLGYGLDEAALAAARTASFEPGSRCGKPSQATFTISMRFTL